MNFEARMTPSQELAALRAVFDSLAEHVAVLDHQGVIRMVNAPWQRFVADNGGDPQKIVGKSSLEVCATARKMPLAIPCLRRWPQCFARASEPWMWWPGSVARNLP